MTTDRHDREMSDGVDQENPWTMTSSGVKFDLLNPNPEMVNVDDIVKAAARIRRFTGHGQDWPVTVAEHSILVHDVMKKLIPTTMIAPDRYDNYLFDALMHDAHEVYVNDLSRPMKIAMRHLMPLVDGKPSRSPYDIIESRCMKAVAGAFGLTYPHPPLVAEADMMALAWEADRLWGPGTATAWNLQAEAEWMEANGPWVVCVGFAAEVLFRGLIQHYQELAGHTCQHERTLT